MPLILKIKNAPAANHITIHRNILLQFIFPSRWHVHRLFLWSKKLLSHKVTRGEKIFEDLCISWELCFSATHKPLYLCLQLLLLLWTRWFYNLHSNLPCKCLNIYYCGFYLCVEKPINFLRFQLLHRLVLISFYVLGCLLLELQVSSPYVWINANSKKGVVILVLVWTKGFQMTRFTDARFWVLFIIEELSKGGWFEEEWGRTNANQGNAFVSFWPMQ